MLQAAMQAQAMATATMLGQNPMFSNMLGNPFMNQFSSQNPQSAFTGMNPLQPNILGAMLQQQQQQQQQQQSAAAQFNVGQLLSDAIKLSSPIGSKPDDEELLIQALCASEKKNQSYRLALEGLHGVSVLRHTYIPP